MMRVVIIGADAAGMSAATAVRGLRDDARIVAFDRGSYSSYSMCGLPMFVGAEIDEAEQLVARTPEQFAAQDITVHTRTEAIGIDAAAGRVRVRDLETSAERDEPYDALMYATGARPVVPPLRGLDRWGQVVQTLDDGVALRRRLDEENVESVVVVGAGYIGLEIAEALVRRGVHTTVLSRAPQVMWSLDPDIAAHVQTALEDHGVDVRLGEAMTQIRQDAEGRCREVVSDAGSHPAELVVLALGAQPNVELAQQAGCAVGETGALVVDDRMRTSVDGIWAGGDCVESLHLVSGRPANVQLGTHANKHGKVAGLDIAGVGGARFPGVVGTAATKLCDLEIARTGLSEAMATEAGLDFEAVSFSGTAQAGYMPDPGQVHVKMLGERGSGRILGAQLVGTGNVAKRIDVAATWCQLGIRAQDAQLMDLAYAPPFGGVWDLLQVGARKLVRELGLSPVL